MKPLLLTILAIFLLSGCATMAKHKAELEAKKLKELDVYYCEECKIYYGFKGVYHHNFREINEAWGISDQNYDQDYTIIPTELLPISRVCPICGKEMARKTPPKLRDVVVIKEEYKPWICGYGLQSPKSQKRR